MSPDDTRPTFGTTAELAAELLEPLALVAGHAKKLLDRADPGDFVLRARLDEILAAATRMEELVDGVGQASEPPETAPPASAPPAEDRLLEDLRREFTDSSFIAELVQTWAETAPRRAGELLAAAEARDREALLVHAHALVAPGKTVGALRLARIAASIERGARDDGWEALRAAVDEVVELVPGTIERLRAQV